MPKTMLQAGKNKAQEVCLLPQDGLLPVTEQTHAGQEGLSNCSISFEAIQSKFGDSVMVGFGSHH